MQNNDNQTDAEDSENKGQKNRTDLNNDICSIWLGMRDSNPRSRDQNPLPYRLANPQYVWLVLCLCGPVL